MLQRIWYNANKLVREITLTLIIKIIVLFGIWYFFFSHPVTDSLTPDSIRQKILGYTYTVAPQRLTTLSNINSYRTFEGERTWSPRV